MTTKEHREKYHLMKGQLVGVQDVYDGPGCAWSAGDVKQVPWLLQTSGISRNSILSLTKRKMGSSVGRGTVIIVSDCMREQCW